MKRRGFLQRAALGSSLPFWLQSCELWDSDYTIQVRSDHATGHLLMQSSTWPVKKGGSTETIIVGGGAAGLAAAYGLKDKHFQLFELSSRLGGTAGSESYRGISMCQGAHYDLDYPHYYGEEVLMMLEALDIIRYEPWKRMWSFRDHQHLVPATRRQQCYAYGKVRGDVIPEGPTKRQFLEIINQYEGKLPLPTRLIDQELQSLDNITFLEFLEARMTVNADFQRQLDYHMMDDYGGRTAQVSALAGIYYFACRPYYRKHVQLFSPPSGNDYFIQKIYQSLPESSVNTNRLVTKVASKGAGFEVHCLNTQEKIIERWEADNVIYAGQKHALKYVFPQDYPLFSQNQYAPWMVINFVCKQDPGSYGYWQNEYLGEEESFLGFIDSSVQFRDVLKDKRVFTAYYCLKPEDREYLTTIPQNAQTIVSRTQDRIEQFLGEPILPSKAFVNVMGHAMAIPRPGFLFQDLSSAGLSYAGVDAGKLPLLFEALDSGLSAAHNA